MIRVNNVNDHEKPTFTFSILTYNCLASNLAEPNYFPYTNPVHLNFSYRSKLFERELQSLNADIICLQEMCENDFQQWLNPFLSRLGYGDGCFAERGGSRAKDGVVIFFKQDKFKLLKQHRLSYFDIAQKQFPTQPTLATYNAALFCLLEIQNTERNRIWICTTHINWNYTLPATQFFQIRALLNELSRLNDHSDDKNPFVIVGDFNSISGSVVQDYIKNGFLTDKADYYSTLYRVYLPLFDNDTNKTSQYLTEPHPYAKTLESAYNENTNLMPFTTKVKNNFCGTIDYIYYQCDCLRPLQLFNALHDDDDGDDDDFTLPNEQHPSDHLPLLAEFALFS